MEKNYFKIAIFVIPALAVFIFIWGYFQYQSKPKTYHLELLYKLTASDPLFYSPAVNVANLKESINTLKKAENDFKEILLKKYATKKKGEAADLSPAVDRYYSDLSSSPQKIFLHPLAFFESLTDISKDTEVFLNRKDSASAEKLLLDYEKAAAFYKKSAEEQLADLLSAAGESQSKEYFLGLSSATNLDIMINDFRIILQNSEALQIEVENRKKCFWEGVCPKPLEFLNSGSSDEAPARIYDLKSGGAEKEFIPDELLKIPESETYQKLGPYIIQTACFGNTPPDDLKPARLIYLFIGDGLFLPKLADENFYYDLSLDKTVFGKRLSEKGIGFDFNPDGANYLCTDLEYWKDVSLAAAGDKLFYLPEMLNAFADHLRVYGYALKVMDSLPPVSHLGAYRFDYAISYFPSVNAFWQIKTKPQYLETEASRPVFWQPYSELKKKFNDDEIKKFHFNSEKIRKEIAQNHESERQ